MRNNLGTNLACQKYRLKPNQLLNRTRPSCFTLVFLWVIFLSFVLWRLSMIVWTTCWYFLLCAPHRPLEYPIWFFVVWYDSLSRMRLRILWRPPIYWWLPQPAYLVARKSLRFWLFLFCLATIFQTRLPNTIWVLLVPQ